MVSADMRLVAAAACFILLGAPPSPRKAKRATAHAAPAPAAAPREPAAPPLVVVETAQQPKVDYQAEIYSGVPLDDPYAKERGLDKGLVLMVFDKQRRLAFRVPHEKIKKRVRLVATAARPPVMVAGLTAPARTDHVDVLDTDDGLVVVDTTTSNAGIFTTSDVYVFPRGASPEHCLAMVASLRAAARERVRAALVLGR